MHDVIGALGCSRSPDAFAFLREVAGSDATRIQHFFRKWVIAVANIGGVEARELLLAFIDPKDGSFTPAVKIENYDAELLASEIARIAASDNEIRQRILSLAAQELGPDKRFSLWKIIARLGDSDAIMRGLSILNDELNPGPHEFWKAFENLFLERRPYGSSEGSYTLEPVACNEIRKRLFQMVLNDVSRRYSAFSLLGQIELWRLENGKPTSEPRHPDFDSGVPWPPLDLLLGDPGHGTHPISNVHRIYARIN